MTAPLENYLRSYRKRSAFSQDEVAFLLGSSSGAKISRYERRGRRPPLETALAYEAIFQVPVSALFAGLYQKVERETAARAQLLARKLAGSEPRKATPSKMALLDALCSAQPAPQNKRP